MKKNKKEQGINNEQGINTESPIFSEKLYLIGNKMADYLFHTLAQTPLTLQGIEESGSKIIICLSGHDFTVKGFKLKESGLTVRKNPDGKINVQSLLDKNTERVVLVSKTTKKYLERDLNYYKERIFCQLDGKGSIITNKIPLHKGNIKKSTFKR